MRGVIIKESEILDQALKGNIDKKPMTTLRTLTKYYFLEENDKNKIEQKLDSYMKNNYVGYKPSKWKDLLNQLVKSVSQYNNFEIKDVDHINITDSEWNEMVKLENKQLEKLAFVLLIYSKVNNIRIFENNNKVNQNLSDILTECGLQRTDENKKLLNQLLVKGYISQGKSCNATAIKVEFVNDEDNVKFRIDNFNNVISYYDEYRNCNKYTECECCYKRILKTKHNIKYCKKCAKKIKNEQNKVYFEKLRKAK